MKKPPMNSKKKIAVFANGWNSENLSYCMDGLREGLEDSSVDLYVFMPMYIKTFVCGTKNLKLTV